MALIEEGRKQFVADIVMRRNIALRSAQAVALQAIERRERPAGKPCGAIFYLTIDALQVGGEQPHECHQIIGVPFAGYIGFRGAHCAAQCQTPPGAGITHGHGDLQLTALAQVVSAVAIDQGDFATLQLIKLSEQA